MSNQYSFATPRAVTIALSVALTGVFAAGVGTGLHFHPRLHGTDEHHTDPNPHDDQEEGETHEEEHLALSRQAFDNLELRLGSVDHGDYWNSVLVPAEVVEIPGRSDLSISAPVTGVIEQVRILPGESITDGQTMFVLRITDEELTEAQTKLLAALTRQGIIRGEIERLTPAIQSGAVPEIRKRDLENELRQLAAQQETLIQQLRGRGLPESVVRSVINQRTLATTLPVQLPVAWRCDNQGGEQADDRSKDEVGYSVENLVVHPGQSVQRGETLCSMAYHAELYVQGTAFESDLDTLERIAQNDWTITAESHLRHADHTGSTDRDALRLLRIDNHMDDQTQTVRFFVLLDNRIESSRSDEQGRHFVQWRFRPGQRIHLRLPVEKWENQITLPLDAVVIDGPNAFVFVEHHDHPHGVDDDHDHDHSHDDDHDHHDHHDVFIELEPVPVRLLHRDDCMVVLADDDELDPRAKIALNNAYKLHLAMKVQSGGGGGHHHHHDH